MAKLFVYTEGMSGALLELAIGALSQAASQRGLQVERVESGAPALGPEDRALRFDEAKGGAADTPHRPATEVVEATRRVLDELFGAAPEKAPAVGEILSAASQPVAPPASAPERAQVKRFVAITACPTGIAHTFMAAKALQVAAEKAGWEIHVETRGSVGAKNELTPAQISEADAVVIAADTGIDDSRFVGKRLHRSGTKDALHDAGGLLKAALEAPPLAGAAGTANKPGADAKGRTGAYKHLMSGVSHMLPFVVAGGLLIALAFTFGGINAEGEFAGALMNIGKQAFGLMLAALAGYIAFSIADRPGLVPGMVGGMLAGAGGSGFLGAILAGYLAGYVTKFLNDSIRLPDTLAGLKPILILPLLSTLILGLAMVFIIGPPVSWLNAEMAVFLKSLQGSSALLLGALLGGMMAIDMGGPINKAAYAFSVGLLADHVNAPMAAVMAAGMTPPLGLFIASKIFKNRFSEAEHAASNAAGVLGLSFITEGAIPFAAADPVRVIPCLIGGSAVAGALSMVTGVSQVVPHGGIFVLLIPNALSPVLPFLIAVAVGSAVTAGLLGVFKRAPSA